MVAGGRALAKVPRPGTVQGIRPKVRGVAFMAIAKERAMARARAQNAKKGGAKR